MSSFILLSAGIGRTMKTLGSRSLLNVDGNIVLEHQVKTIRSVFPKADIMVIAGHQYKKVIEFAYKKDLDIRLIENKDYEISSQCDSLIMAFNASIKDDIYVIHGDIIFNKESLLGPHNSHVVLDRTITNKRSVGLCHQDGVLKNMAFGLDEKWGQITMIDKEHFAIAKNIVHGMSGKSTYEWVNALSTKMTIYIHSCGVKTREISKGHESTNSL